MAKTYEAVSPLPPDADDDGPVLGRFPLTVRSRIRKDKGVLRSVVEEVPAAASGRRAGAPVRTDRKSTRLNSSHSGESRMPSSA